jgi:hypothetical protein
MTLEVELDEHSIQRLYARFHVAIGPRRRRDVHQQGGRRGVGAGARGSSGHRHGHGTPGCAERQSLWRFSAQRISPPRRSGRPARSAPPGRAGSSRRRACSSTCSAAAPGPPATAWPHPDTATSATAPTARPACGRLQDRRRHRGPAPQPVHQADHALLHRQRVGQAHRGLQAHQAERALQKTQGLALRAVRGVVGGKTAQRAVAQRLHQGRPVLRSAQRRVHLVVGVGRVDVGIAQRQVMRGQLAGHAHAAGPPLANSLRARRAGHMLNVQRATGFPGQFDVAADDALLGPGRDPRQAVAARDVALVHHPALPLDQVVLRVVHQHHAQPRGLAHDLLHDRIILHRAAVVGEGDRAGVAQRSQRRRLLTFASQGQRARGQDAGQADLPPAAGHIGHGLDVIVRRLGVGHGHHGGEAAGGSRAGTRLDGFVILAARLAQVHVQVDEAGDDQAARGRHDRGARGGALDDDAPRDCEVAHRIFSRDGIEHAPALDQPIRLHGAGL